MSVGESPPGAARRAALAFVEDALGDLELAENREGPWTRTDHQRSALVYAVLSVEARLAEIAGRLGE